METTGILFDIKRFAVHDGPGIRTTLFLKGCPLRCLWCHNPEGISRKPQLAFHAHLCIRCGECIPVCPEGVHDLSDAGRVLRRDRCVVCGRCSPECLGRALRLYGATMTVSEAAKAAREDRDFYAQSGGGVTLSGGEPLLQGEFAAELLRAARKAAINTAVETCGYVPWRNLECAIPYLDYLLYDVKHIDSAKHQLYTGVSTQTILENLKRAAPLATHVIVRVPVIPGFNDTAEEIRAIANYTAGLKGIAALHLLPYHRHGQAKYEQLNRTYELEGISPLTAEREEELAAIVRETGLECRIRG